MKTSNKFSPEVRERAVRLVQEHRGEYPSLWATGLTLISRTQLDWVFSSSAELVVAMTGGWRWLCLAVPFRS